MRYGNHTDLETPTPFKPFVRLSGQRKASQLSLQGTNDSKSVEQFLSVGKLVIKTANLKLGQEASRVINR